MFVKTVIKLQTFRLEKMILFFENNDNLKNLEKKTSRTF